MLALEPEAAAVHCRNQQKGLTFSPGTRYMVVDCGGGTVDMVLHEIDPKGNFSSLFFYWHLLPHSFLNLFKVDNSQTSGQLEHHLNNFLLFVYCAFLIYVVRNYKRANASHGGSLGIHNG
jgi:hypothetical protein